VDEALKNEEVGTFLIRFSERHAGLFAVGYKIDDAVNTYTNSTFHLLLLLSPPPSSLPPHANAGFRTARAPLPRASGRHRGGEENAP
jgi:hypothetical protein